MRPIDALVRVLLPELCWGQTEPPYKVLQKTNMEELATLKSEIQEFKVLPFSNLHPLTHIFEKVLDCQHPDHVDYWKCIEALCGHEWMLAQKQEAAGIRDPKDVLERQSFGRERHFYVEDEITNILAGLMRKLRL